MFFYLLLVCPESVGGRVEGGVCSDRAGSVGTGSGSRAAVFVRFHHPGPSVTLTGPSDAASRAE